MRNFIAITMHELKWRAGSTLKPFKFMEAKFSRHKRSNSDPCQRKSRKPEPRNIFEVSHHLKQQKIGNLKDYGEDMKRQPQNTKVQNSLKQEILELQGELHDQYMLRTSLEKALSHKPFSHDIVTDKSVPKHAKDLIKEIAVLEMEVLYLEKYLLSVYRKIFDKRVSKLPTINEQPTLNLRIQEQISPVVPDHGIVLEKDNSAIQTSHFTSGEIGNLQDHCKCTWGPEELSDSGIHRCHSSKSQRWTGSSRMKSLARAADSCHSLPLSMLEQAQNTTPNTISLEDHLGTCVKDKVQEMPNWLSEKMIRSISAIYCELADPPLINPGYLSSPFSFSSSSNEFPSQGQDDMWSPQYGNFSSFNSSLDNPFDIRESKEFSAPYSSMAKVQQICEDSLKLKDAEEKLQTFKSLVSRLEYVDPRKLKHEEKLAFWINVHNALVMHAFLVCGIPQNNTKKVCLILKVMKPSLITSKENKYHFQHNLFIFQAAYNVGGHNINVNTMQNYILGCQLPRPGQWRRLLYSSRKKFKDGDARAAFSIEKPEPRLYFALCSGSHSDPAVRAFNPKTVFEDLEAAKEEYIQSTFIVHKEKKLLLPKIVESFAKDSDLCPTGLLEMVEYLLPESLRKTIQYCQYRKYGKTIEWIPHNYTFSYLISKELSQ